MLLSWLANLLTSSENFTLKASQVALSYILLYVKTTWTW